MSSNGYKILGYAVWHGGKWYLRRRRPSARKMLLVGATATSALIGAGLLAKRFAG